MESSNGMSQGQEINSQPAISSPATTGTSPPVQTSEEKVFKQSEVNEIVKRAKHGAVEDFRRLQSEQPNYVQQKYGDASQQPIPSAPSNLAETDVKRLAAEEIQRFREQWAQEEQAKVDAAGAQRTVQNFWNKLSPGKEKYSDFDSITGDIQWRRFPNVVRLLGDFVDNSHDVAYELGKDRVKMSQLEQLAMMSPEDAIIHAQRLSQSIKDNETAGKYKIPNEPLSQVRPSNTGTDNGAMSVKDYRAKYRV